MARLYLIVDGYNLMHAVGIRSKRHDKGRSDRNRTDLLNRLGKKLNPELHSDTTIVFDGAEDCLRPQNQHFGFTVRFAGYESDADTEIEKLLGAHSAPKQVLVVSSDHRLHKAADRRRASAIDSDAFWDLIDDPDGSDLLASIESIRSFGKSRDTDKPVDLTDFELPDDFYNFENR